SELAQQARRAPAVPPELAVEPQHERPRTQAAHERVRDEVLGRDLAQPLVEREYERVLDPRASEQLEPVLEARQRPRLVSEQHLLRMASKGDDGRQEAELARASE